MLGQIERFSAAVGGATRVLLVPSTRDVHAHPVLPQPPLEVGSRSGAQALANPATLRCNEVVLGAGAADWLLAAGREEVCGGRTEERLPALGAHLAAQRSYYPLFPPPADVPLDCSLGAGGLAMPCTPDLLVTPSDLAPFAKLCPVHTAAPGQAAAADGGASQAAPEAQAASGGSMVCVNPGRLAKGSAGEQGRRTGLVSMCWCPPAIVRLPAACPARRACPQPPLARSHHPTPPGGTFAHIHILPLPEAVAVAGGAPAATNAPVPHQLERRCRVEVKRI